MDMRFGRGELAGTARVNGYNALQLAYIGDTVYDLFVRTYLLENTDQKAGALHRRAVGLVRAAAQAEALDRLYSSLTPGEMDIARRGRNAKAHHLPRGVDKITYSKATALEALIGYLYLTGEDARLTQLMRCAITPEINRSEPETDTERE